MTNKEKMKRIINNDFNKKNNRQLIISKIENKHNKAYLEYAIIPTILVIVISIVLINKINNNQIKSFKDESVNTNNINTTSKNDGEDFDELNNLNNINIPYFEILKNIKIPDDFDVFADGKGVCISKDKNDKDYGKINNYELWFKNSKNNRKIIIALSDKNIPYRDSGIDRKNSNKTIINGIEVEIYKHKNTYVSIFSYKGYNFDIESCDIIEEEYIRLLYSLIK